MNMSATWTNVTLPAFALAATAFALAFSASSSSSGSLPLAHYRLHLSVLLTRVSQ
jgi:hypothetical protein